MERGNFESMFEHKNEKPHFHEIFYVQTKALERETGLDSRTLDRYRYSSQLGFQKVDAEHPRNGTEVLLSQETSTLVVPPPTPGPLHIEDLAEMAVPVVGFIDSIKPDIIVGCDRGGRLYTTAVAHVRSARDTERLATLDGKVHFAKLSTSIKRKYVTGALHKIIGDSIRHADRVGKKLNGVKPRILFIDDWILSGRTREHILEALGDLDIDIQPFFAVMCGGSADASGGNLQSVPWQDNSDIIGVDYDEYGRGYATRTQRSFDVRRKLQKAVKAVAKKVY